MIFFQEAQNLFEVMPLLISYLSSIIAQ